MCKHSCSSPVEDSGDPSFLEIPVFPLEEKRTVECKRLVGRKEPARGESTDEGKRAAEEKAPAAFPPDRKPVG